MASVEVRGVNPRQFHVGFLRTGDALMNHSKLSPDSETKMGVKRAAEALENGSLLILDAHRTWMDIAFSAARLSHELPIDKYLIPYTAYLENRMTYSKLLKQIKRQVQNVEMIPVIREEDQIGYDGELGVTPRGVGFTKEETAVLNRRYLKRALELIKENIPGIAIVVAPYGSRRTYRIWFRDGVLGLVKKGVPILVTLSAREPGANLDHTTFVSGELFRFDRNHSDDDINAVVDAQFEDLERKAGIS